MVEAHIWVKMECTFWAPCRSGEQAAPGGPAIGAWIWIWGSAPRSGFQIHSLPCVLRKIIEKDATLSFPRRRAGLFIWSNISLADWGLGEIIQWNVLVGTFKLMTLKACTLFDKNQFCLNKCKMLRRTLCFARDMGLESKDPSHPRLCKT